MRFCVPLWVIRMDGKDLHGYQPNLYRTRDLFPIAAQWAEISENSLEMSRKSSENLSYENKVILFPTQSWVVFEFVENSVFSPVLSPFKRRPICMAFMRPNFCYSAPYPQRTHIPIKKNIVHVL